MTEVMQTRMDVINSHIETFKEELSIDFTIDVSEGFPNLFPEVYTFNFRYKPYTFIAILPQYSNGTPWTNIFDNAIAKIIEIEDLQVTKTEAWRCRGDRVNSTTNTYSLEKRENMEDCEVNEIIGTGGFARTYYITHNINDIDHKTLLDGFDNEQEGEWPKVANMVALYDAVKNYTDPRTMLANKLEDLKREFLKHIEPTIHEYSNKMETAFEEYFASIESYKVGDIVETTYDGFYVISQASNNIVDSDKLTFKHEFPKRWVQFNKDIKTKDIKSQYYFGKKINKSGAVSLKETNVYGIKDKVGEIKDYKPAGLRNLMAK
jgi:hypothetical protein